MQTLGFPRRIIESDTIGPQFAQPAHVPVMLICGEVDLLDAMTKEITRIQHISIQRQAEGIQIHTCQHCDMRSVRAIELDVFNYIG